MVKKIPKSLTDYTFVCTGCAAIYKEADFALSCIDCGCTSYFFKRFCKKHNVEAECDNDAEIPIYFCPKCEEESQ